MYLFSASAARTLDHTLIPSTVDSYTLALAFPANNVQPILWWEAANLYLSQVCTHWVVAALRSECCNRIVCLKKKFMTFSVVPVPNIHLQYPYLQTSCVVQRTFTVISSFAGCL